MTRLEPPHSQLPRVNWQSLGQLKLVAGSNHHGTIRSWLINTPRDFGLPGDIVSRFLASMEEATARLLSSDSMETRFEYLEIAVLAQAGETSKRHIWIRRRESKYERSRLAVLPAGSVSLLRRLQGR